MVISREEEMGGGMGEQFFITNLIKLFHTLNHMQV